MTVSSHVLCVCVRMLLPHGRRSPDGLFIEVKSIWLEQSSKITPVQTILPLTALHKAGTGWSMTYMPNTLTQNMPHNVTVLPIPLRVSISSHPPIQRAHCPPPPLLSSCTTYCLIRERDVDELVQSSRTENGSVNDVLVVGSSDDEHILLLSHSIHLSEELVDDTIGCTTCRGKPGEAVGGGRGTEQDKQHEMQIPALHNS